MNGTLKRILYTCNYLRTQENKIDLYYQLNIKYITIKGPWLCAYGGIRTPAIIIDKYSSPIIIPTFKPTLPTIGELDNLQNKWINFFVW